MALYSPIDSADRNTGIDLTIAGTLPTGSDTFAPGSNVYLRVTPTANNITVAVTFPTAVDAYGVGVASVTLNGGAAIPSGADRIFGPFPAAGFADPSDGLVHLTNTGTFTGTTMRVYQAQNG